MAKSNHNAGGDALNKSVDVYTEEELALLDKYQLFNQKKFDDDEIYEVILQSNFDEEKIVKALKEKMRDLLKGEDYEWHEIGKKKPKKSEEKRSNHKHNGKYERSSAKLARQSEANLVKERNGGSYKTQRYDKSQKYNEGYNEYKESYNGYDGYNDGKSGYNWYNGYSYSQGWRNNRGYRRNYNQNYRNSNQTDQLIEVELPSPADLREKKIEKEPEVERKEVIPHREIQSQQKEAQQLSKHFAVDEIFNKSSINKEAEVSAEEIQPVEVKEIKAQSSSFIITKIEPLPIEFTQTKPEVKVKQPSQLSVDTNVAFTLETAQPPKKEPEPPKETPQPKMMPPYYQPQPYSPYNGYEMPYMMMPYMMHEPPTDGNVQMKQQPMYYPYFYYPMEQEQRTDFGPMKQQPQQRFYRPPPQYNMPYIPPKKQ